MQNSGNDKLVAIKSAPARFNAANLTIEQFEATSKDGTKIPYFVTRPKMMKGPAPTILYGYGGFDLSMTPSYTASSARCGFRKAASMCSPISAAAASSDRAGTRRRKGKPPEGLRRFPGGRGRPHQAQNTTPKQLGILGASNGGLLVSANMVERPDLFGAVVCQVPLTDMMRYPQIGAGASWLEEYGDPGDPQVRDALLAYSPYQNVKPDVKYPPVFFITATSDDRVTPAHARKMAAKMEAQGHDVMFYENTDGGHAAAADIATQRRCGR